MSMAEEGHAEKHKLDRAFVGGVAWTAGAKWLSQLVSWPSVLITARLLSPDDYGLMEMAGVYFIVTNVMAEFGIGMAVLQMRELDMAVTAQLNTMAVISGIVAFLVSVGMAPLIADFFSAPALNRLVIVASLSFILTSLEAIPLGLLQRKMDYRRLSIAESAQAVITAVVSVGCAYAGLGYWSLLVGNLVGRTGNIALARYWCPVPFAMPHWEQISKPLRFGMEIAAQRVAGSINLLSDIFVIGRVLGPGPLGAYRFATNLASAPAEKTGSLVMRVTGPLFSRVQNDKELMRRYFLIFTETLSMAVFPLVFGMATVAPEAVERLLGPKWEAAAAPLRWLAVYMAIRSMGYLVSQLLTTLRLTRFGMWMSLANFAVMPIGFYIASKWGLGMVAATWLFLSPLTFLPMAVKVLRAIHCSFLQYLTALLPALLGSASMIVAIEALRHWVTLAGWPGLGTEVATGGLAYAAVLWGFYRRRLLTFYRFFMDLRKSPDAAVMAQ